MSWNRKMSLRKAKLILSRSKERKREREEALTEGHIDLRKQIGKLGNYWWNKTKEGGNQNNNQIKTFWVTFIFGDPCFFGMIPEREQWSEPFLFHFAVEQWIALSVCWCLDLHQSILVFAFKVADMWINLQQTNK